jgi:hypothetical protein
MTPRVSAGLPLPALLDASCPSRIRLSRSMRSASNRRNPRRHWVSRLTATGAEQSRAAAELSPRRLDLPQRIEHADIVGPRDDPDDTEAPAVSHQKLVPLGPVGNDRLELAELVPLVRVEAEAKSRSPAGARPTAGKRQVLSRPSVDVGAPPYRDAAGDARYGLREAVSLRPAPCAVFRDAAQGRDIAEAEQVRSARHRRRG